MTDPQRPPAHRAHPPGARPLARHLSQLVWIAVGPLLLVGAVLAFLDVQRVRKELEAQAAERASALAIATDNALRSRTRGLQMLAASPVIDDPAQRAEAYRLAGTFVTGYGAHVILADRQLQMLFNTRAPLGASLPGLPRVQGRAAAPLALETGLPAVGDTFEGPVAKTQLVAIAVPVMRDGAARYLLLTTLETRQFQRYLDELQLPAGWGASLHDSQGRVVISRGHGTDVSATAPEPGAFRAGRALTRAPWTAHVDIPAHALASPMQKAALGLGAALLLTTISGVAAASFVARRLSRSVALLGHPGAPPDSDEADVSTGVAEFDRVRDRLGRAERDRAAALAALADSEGKYRELFDRSPNPMWVYDRETLRYLAVNAAAVAHYGYSQDEFLAMTLGDIRPESERRRLEATIGGDRGGPERRHQSYGTWIHRTRDGRLIDVEITIADLQFDGRPARIALAHDITARLEAGRQRDDAQRKLHASEARYRALFENSPDMILLTTTQGRLLQANPAACQAFGVDEAHLLRLGRAELVDESDPRLAQLLLERERHGTARGEISMRRVDGSPMPVELSSAVFPGPSGEPKAVLVLRDISSRLAAEARLRDSAREFRTLAEQLPAIVYRARMDPLGQTDYVSPRVAELGFTPEQWRADPNLLWQAIHPEDLDRVRSELHAAYGHGGRELHTEFRMRGAGGDWRHRADHSQLVDPEDGRPRFLLGFNMDMTQARQSEAALRTYQHELSQLTHRLLEQERVTSHHIAQALHDHLGQNLAVARLHLDAAIVRHGERLEPDIRGELQRLSGQLDQAIRDVRLVLGELRPPMLEEQGLIAALDNETRARSLDPQGTDVLLEIDDGALAMRWPPDVEYAALMIAREAIVNAQRHAGASLVRVIVGGDGRQLLLEVVDDGHGIPDSLRTGRPGHLGLVGMRERAVAIHGQLSIGTAAGGGARVALEWKAPAAGPDTPAPGPTPPRPAPAPVDMPMAKAGSA